MGINPRFTRPETFNAADGSTVKDKHFEGETMEDGVYVNVTFEECIFDGSAEGARFVNCTFLKCMFATELDGARTIQCNFVGCFGEHGVTNPLLGSITEFGARRVQAANETFSRRMLAV